MERAEILTIGHYCHDLLIGEAHDNTEALGGSVAYSAGVLSALGIGFRIASKVGEDFKYFDQCRERPLVARGFKTTGFVDDYTSGERVATVSAICDLIRPEDLPVDAEVAVISGVMNEIPAETILAAASRSRTLLCDIQGLIRAAAPGEKLRHVHLDRTPYAALMDRFAAVKVSRHELPFVDFERLRRQTLVLLTEDDRGCTVFDARQSYAIPTRKIEPVDSTGAGDCFLAGFAYGFLRDFGLEKSAAFANHCGGLAVSQVGVPKLAREDFAGWI